ncbi:formate dehydrogenase accessory sulfurtransferase FdhD [uncultured Sphingomonas sp.]|uniref:formate dehydrogenase accessory sulfurtransferase FdhD n=1 Tax=uncultured Sphingomonas sp. TaxID=158754 RepID=UPI0025DD8DCC|nr:formate dehydrogenase accessory sulfurtransferase FdhD [uncultured Sphingomonas sp.]
MSVSRPEPIRVLHADGRATAGLRDVAVEAPVAIEVDGLGYAVMMMTPRDLDVFALGFMLTERLADTAADVEDIDVFAAEAGWIVRVALAAHCRPRIHDRVRHRSSDTGCGLCGIASLEQLARPVRQRPPCPAVEPAAIFAALAAIRSHQRLNAATGAVHAAAACTADGAIAAIFEDVGRHNALDKLIGAQARVSAGSAFTLVTSRISFEMVDKALVATTPLLVGISAPTSFALDHARAHGLTLIALARSDAMLVMNDPFGAFA